MMCVDLNPKPVTEVSVSLLFQGLPGPIGPVGPKGARVCTRPLPVWCVFELTTLSLWYLSCLSGLWLPLLGHLQCLIFYKELKMKFRLFLTFLSTYLSFKVKWFDLDSIRGVFTTTARLFFRLPLVFWFSLFLFFESTETQPWQICCWQLPKP